MTLSIPANRPALHRTVLSNGLTVLVIENPVADIVSARLLIKAGTGREARSQAGLFSLLSSLLTKGTRDLSSMEIAEQVESVGASVGPMPPLTTVWSVSKRLPLTLRPFLA